MCDSKKNCLCVCDKDRPRTSLADQSSILLFGGCEKTHAFDCTNVSFLQVVVLVCVYICAFVFVSMTLRARASRCRCGCACGLGFRYACA